jgi:hypothetical protein
MTNKFIKKRDKIRAQMKSRFYYMFWGAATVSVFAGQMYVGSGYRQMSNSLDTLVDSYVNRPRIVPVDKDRQTSQSPYKMPIVQ